MKKIFIISIIGITIPLLFFLLEPIFRYNSGWQSFPESNKLSPLILHQDLTSRKADTLLKDIFLELKTPSISIAIGRNDSVVYSNTIGYKDVKNKQETDLKTRYRIGSTSKAVTAVGLGVLIQDKKIHLDSKVKEFVPYASTILSDITVRQLASHTSGIRNYGTCFCFPIWEIYSTKEYFNVEESIDVFNKDALLFSPGEDFSYSTYNFTMLSAMMEGASKINFPDFMYASVFKPLGIHIAMEQKNMEIKNISKFYEIEENKYKEVFKVDNSNKLAGGGMVASPTDLVLLGNAFLNRKLLDNETTKLLTEPVTLDNGTINEQKYAIGWRVSTTESIFEDKRKVKIFHHAGTANGSTSMFILFPEYNTSISLLINKSESSSNLSQHAYELVKLFINVY